MAAGAGVFAPSTAIAASTPRPLEDAVAVIAGSDLGNEDEEPLRYAASDARRFRDVLVELGGLHANRALLIADPTPDSIHRALAQAVGHMAEINSSGHRTTFLFYFSGHGDEETLHTQRGGLDLVSLRSEIDRIPASVHVVVLDACRTARRQKGVTRGPSFSVHPDTLHGTIELRASAIGEAAQESDALSGAVFTHHLISALRGDADIDRDGRVTIAELYSYTYRHTMLDTGEGGALQHPAASIMLSGVGELVLTMPAQASAQIELPGGAERYVVFSLPSSAVMAEADGEGPRKIALPAGRFLVARRTRHSAAIASVDLSLGGRAELRVSDFQPVAAGEFVRRGGRIELRRGSIGLRGGVEFAPRGPEGPAGRVGIAAGYARGRLAVEAELAYVGGSEATGNLNGSSQAVSGVLRAGLRAFFTHATLTAALGCELRYSWIRLRSDEAARASLAGLASGESPAYGSLGPRVDLWMAIPIGHHLSAELGAGAALLVRREHGDLSPFPLLALSVGMGYGF